MSKRLLEDFRKAWIALAHKDSNVAHAGKICCALDSHFKQIAKGKRPSYGQAVA